MQCQLQQIAPQLQEEQHQQQLARLMKKFGTPLPESEDEPPKEAPQPPIQPPLQPLQHPKEESAVERPTKADPRGWVDLAESVERKQKEAKGAPATPVAVAATPGKAVFVPVGAHSWEQVRCVGERQVQVG